MKFLAFFGFLLLTVALIVALDRPWGSVPPLGRFLSPQHGFWQNAEPAEGVASEQLSIDGLKAPVDVYLDDRLVPHVFASSDEDAYFTQGYLHAKYRLWQMEFQTYAAAGRISELIGSKALAFDREKRRLGMVYAAEKQVQAIEADPLAKSMMDSYTAGVNAWIAALPESKLPLEYKLLNYKPEKWSNLKTALFIKYMALDLAGGEEDFENTNLRDAMGYDTYDKLFPVTQDSLDPIVPHDTTDYSAIAAPKAPAGSDSLYLHRTDSTLRNISRHKPDKDNGSNNWVVSGKKTKSGAPILCNDPHLGLHLPSLWFEMQLSTPAMNVYGVTLPGAPGVVIGFNDSVAFGLTNAERDVRDYYEIRFKDDTRAQYWFEGDWRNTEFRSETIGIKDSVAFVDSVAYTVFGPVMYDKGFTGNRTTGDKYYAVRWKAHDSSDELRCFHGLDHAKNYTEYLDAIKFMHAPGQNFAFAAKNGDIAMWCQGEFPAKWKRQGDFVMPGEDSSYMWQGNIPQELNPHQVNPARGFVSSANQLPENPLNYPYYLGGSYPLYRGIMINKVLNQENEITPENMMRLQTDTYNIFAQMARPLILHFIDSMTLPNEQRGYFHDLSTWDLQQEPDSRGASVFVTFWDSLMKVVYADDMARVAAPMPMPPMSTLLENLLRDSSYAWLDDTTTPAKETLREDMQTAFRQATGALRWADKDGRMAWGRYKETSILHLLQLGPLSRGYVNVGGGNNCISAMKKTHGPSWRMIVQLGTTAEAYGVYPGGQSGNPGSPYYENFIDTWASNKYYPLWVMSRDQAQDKRIQARLTFTNAR